MSTTDAFEREVFTALQPIRDLIVKRPQVGTLVVQAVLSYADVMGVNVEATIARARSEFSARHGALS